MTPREWAREQRAAQLRWTDDYRRDVRLAHQSAALWSRAWAGQLPPLKTLLEQITTTMERHHNPLMVLSTHLGIPARPLSPEARAALDRMQARELAARGQ